MRDKDVVQRSIENFDSKSKIILKQIEICTGNSKNPAIKSILDNLISLREIYISFLSKNLSQEKYFQQLHKHRHEILSIAEFSYGQSQYWYSMRREILRFLGKNGIGSPTPSESREINTEFGDSRGS